MAKSTYLRGARLKTMLLATADASRQKSLGLRNENAYLTFKRNVETVLTAMPSVQPESAGPDLAYDSSRRCALASVSNRV